MSQTSVIFLASLVASAVMVLMLFFTGNLPAG